MVGEGGGEERERAGWLLCYFVVLIRVCCPLDFYMCTIRCTFTCAIHWIVTCVMWLVYSSFWRLLRLHSLVVEFSGHYSSRFNVKQHPAGIACHCGLRGG